ncbi:hypothetical protein ACOMHN_014974 [Nucella lapillus]
MMEQRKDDLPLQGPSPSPSPSLPPPSASTASPPPPPISSPPASTSFVATDHPTQHPYPHSHNNPENLQAVSPPLRSAHLVDESSEPVTSSHTAPHSRNWWDVADHEDDDYCGIDVTKRKKRSWSFPFCSKSPRHSSESWLYPVSLSKDSGSDIAGWLCQHQNPHRGRRASVGTGEEKEQRPGVERDEETQWRFHENICQGEERDSSVVSTTETKRKCCDNSHREIEGRFGEESNKETERRYEQNCRQEKRSSECHDEEKETRYAGLNSEEEIGNRNKARDEEEKQQPGTYKARDDEAEQQLPGTCKVCDDEEKQQRPGTYKARDDEAEQQLPGTYKVCDDEEKQQRPGTYKARDDEDEQQLPGTYKVCDDEEKQQRPGTYKARDDEDEQQLPGTYKVCDEEKQQLPGTYKASDDEEKQQLPGTYKASDDEEKQQLPGTYKASDDEEKQQLPGTYKASDDEEKQPPSTNNGDEQQKCSTHDDFENQKPQTSNDDIQRIPSENSDDISSDDDGDVNPCIESIFHRKLEGWRALPAILLEDIFAMLTPKQRHQASMVCRPWYDIFYSPRVWHSFVLWERTLTKRRFNLYKGYQRELCPRKTQVCLMRVGCYIRHITVTAISDYYNLYEFLRVLSSFLTFHPTFPMPLLTSFHFTFACESRGVNGTAIIGTGGNILSKLKDLVCSMQGLKHLTLNQLLLEIEEVQGLLAAAACSSAETLQCLELLNCSKVPVPMCEVSQFPHLLTLTVSPQHLSEEMVLLLGGTQLLQLHVLQDAYTCACGPVSPGAWKLFRDMAPEKRVFLEVQGRTKTPLLIQPHAPVRGVVIRTPYHQLTAELLLSLLEHYTKSLEYFVQEGLPRTHGSRKFPDRADERLMRLVQGCPRLHTLVIRERLSLATMLLLGKEGGTLRSLTLRKNALLKKCEWPQARAWTDDFYRRLRTHGRDYDLAFSQMPVLLKRPWKPTVDKVFKHLKVHLT